MTPDQRQALFDHYNAGAHPQDNLTIKTQRAIFGALCDLIELAGRPPIVIETETAPPPAPVLSDALPPRKAP